MSQKTNQILDRFLPYEARAEISQKFGLLYGKFFGVLKTPKFHSEINLPLSVRTLSAMVTLFC